MKNEKKENKPKQTTEQVPASVEAPKQSSFIAGLERNATSTANTPTNMNASTSPSPAHYTTKSNPSKTNASQ
jgi:hypothetical protein